MAYETTNPPRLASQAIAGMRIWEYTDGDAIATVDGTDYFGNGGGLGMQVGDIVFVVDTGNDLTTISHVSAVTAAGAATVVALTAVP